MYQLEIRTVPDSTSIFMYFPDDLDFNFFFSNSLETQFNASIGKYSLTLEDLQRISFDRSFTISNMDASFLEGTASFSILTDAYEYEGKTFMNGKVNFHISSNGDITAQDNLYNYECSLLYLEK